MSKPSKTLSLVGLISLAIITVITLVLLNNIRFDESLRALFNRDHGLYDEAMGDRSKRYLLNVLPMIGQLNNPSLDSDKLRREILGELDFAYAYLNVGRYIEHYDCVPLSLEGILAIRNDVENRQTYEFHYQMWGDILHCYESVHHNQDHLKSRLIERALIDSRANQFWMNVGVILVFALGIMLWLLLELQSRRGHKNEVEKQAWQTLAMTDHLTSTYNRMALHESLEKLVRQWPQTGKSVGLVLFDIDNFKLFNDTFGHVAGDDALRKVADAVSGLLSSNSQHYRYGGEEFFILSHDVVHSELLSLADKILSTVQNLNIRNPKSESGILTVSVGVYMMEHREYSVDELINKVDELLYIAKKHGRNRVVDEFS